MLVVLAVLVLLGDVVLLLVLLVAAKDRQRVDVAPGGRGGQQARHRPSAARPTAPIEKARPVMRTEFITTSIRERSSSSRSRLWRVGITCISARTGSTSVSDRSGLVSMTSASTRTGGSAVSATRRLSTAP